MERILGKDGTYYDMGPHLVVCTETDNHNFAVYKSPKWADWDITIVVKGRGGLEVDEDIGSAYQLKWDFAE